MGSRHARAAHPRHSLAPTTTTERPSSPRPTSRGTGSRGYGSRPGDAALLRRGELAREQTDSLLCDVTDQHPLGLGDTDAVVLLNLGLADGIASRYLGRGIERDDLVQVARLGLVKAVRRYRPALGQSFAGYAAPTISGEIKRHFRDTGWMVRPPRRLQELGARLRDAEKELEQQLHRDPTPGELARFLGVEEAQVRAAREASSSFHAVSLDAPVTTEHRPDLAVDSDDDPFGAFDDAQWLSAALSELSDRERTVLRLRFVELKTQSEIAQDIGVSQMQVSRILRATLARLRSRLQESVGDAA
jgi:RNA polymerase sigma-B factor